MEDKKHISLTKKIMLAVSAVILILIALTISHYSIIDVSVQGSSGTIDYSFLNQVGQKPTTSQAGSHLRKIVPKGNYEILVSQANKSSFAVVKTSGFLRKTPVQLSLSAEKNREFIGNNPQPCTFFDGDSLYSYACGADLSKVVKHEPATSTLPTYTSKLPDTLSASVLGIAKTSNGSVILLRQQGTSVFFSVATLDSGFNIKNPRVLSELDRSVTYNIRPYRDGFVIYDSDFSKVFYYSSVSASPQTLNIAKLDDNSQKPSFLTAVGDKILALYSNNSQGQDTDIEATVGKIKNTVVIYSQDQSRKFSIDKQQIIYASTCGQGKLCLVSDKQLSIYDINSSSPKFLFKVRGVNSTFSSANGLVLVRDNEILRLDVDHQTGFREYSVGDYQLCGTQNDLSGYTLCLINNKDIKVALRIDESIDNKDSIDKKVVEFQKAPEMKSVSIYKNYIYISPNLGQLKYDSAAKGYVYDSDIKKKVNAAVDQKIKELKIDTNIYHIINIFK